MRKLIEGWNVYLNEEELARNNKLKLFKEALNEELVDAGHETLSEEYIDYALNEIFGIGSSKKDKSKNWFKTEDGEEAFKSFFKSFTTSNQRLRDALKDLEALDAEERSAALNQMSQADNNQEKEKVLDNIEDAAEEAKVIPIFKYPKEKDPETGKRTPPLQACLAAPKKCPDLKPITTADIPQNVINVIIRNIAQQLKASNVQLTESVKKDVIRITLEKLLHEDLRSAISKSNKPQTGDILARAKQQEKNILVQAPEGFMAQKASGEQKLFKVTDGDNPDDVKRVRKAANAWLSGISKGPPNAWITQGGTQEEWDALPSKEKFVFLKMPSNKQSKFFKMGSDKRMDVYKQLKTSTSKSKSAIGAKKVAMAQAAKDKAIADRGSKGEEGTVKLSALNQQLQTINPPVDKKTRKIALKIVQKYLAPYMKKYDMKFSEQQHQQVALRILNNITERINERQ